MLAFLQSRETVVVAAADPQGVPWAVPVFYVSDGFSLYWLSSPSNRLGAYLQENPRAVVCILGDSSDRRRMQGLQMEGMVQRIEGRWEQFKVARKYLRRYAALGKMLLSSRKETNMAAKGMSMRLYRFTPARCWFTDHGRGFGHRVELDLSQEVNSLVPDLERAGADA